MKSMLRQFERRIARRRKAWSAIYVAMLSPEFATQR
jgi:hypothetical protein